MVEFKPSQVVLDVIPLVATMGKAEIEFAAGCLVYACVSLGDAWQAVRVRQVADIFAEAFTARTEPIYTWGRNPFVRPEPALMVERGFAVFEGDDGPDLTIAFTDRGLAALQRWVRREASHG